MHTIYFGTIYLNQQIHCQALGFTKMFYAFAWASSVTEAEQLIAKWAVQKGCDVNKVQAVHSVSQDFRRFAFLHQIINIPADLLEAEYERRNYPASYRDPAYRVTLDEAEVVS